MATVYERLKKIIVKILRVKEEEITPSTSFTDELGADSLDLVRLIMDIEDEFSNTSLKVDIPDEDAEKILTVQDALDYLIDSKRYGWSGASPDGYPINGNGHILNVHARRAYDITVCAGDGFLLPLGRFAYLPYHALIPPNFSTFKCNRFGTGDYNTLKSRTQGICIRQRQLDKI